MLNECCSLCDCCKIVKIAGDVQHIMFNDTDTYIVFKVYGIVRKMESALTAHFGLKRPFFNKLLVVYYHKCEEMVL